MRHTLGNSKSMAMAALVINCWTTLAAAQTSGSDVVCDGENCEQKGIQDCDECEEGNAGGIYAIAGGTYCIKLFNCVDLALHAYDFR